MAIQRRQAGYTITSNAWAITDLWRFGAREAGRAASKLDAWLQQAYVSQPSAAAPTSKTARCRL